MAIFEGLNWLQIIFMSAGMVILGGMVIIVMLFVLEFLWEKLVTKFSKKAIRIDNVKLVEFIHGELDRYHRYTLDGVTERQISILRSLLWDSLSKYQQREE